MLFTDSTFLLIGLPTLSALYFVTVALAGRESRSGLRNAARANWVLLVASVIFLAAGAGVFAGAIVAVAVLTHLSARGMRRAQTAAGGTMAEALLTIGLSGNLLLFIIFKYAYPISDQSPPGLERAVAVPQLLLPFGLVLFTCHAVAYLIDVYRREALPHANLMDAALYLFFFPVSIMGPILRHRDVCEQFGHRDVGMAAFAYGVRRFAVGLGKVVLIAGTLAGPANVIFDMPPDRLGVVAAWLGAVSFSLQIYFQLSGYADMAVGLGRVFGFRLPENFKWPYAAGTLHDFWRRWNISLLAWLSTYADIPLEGRRQGWREYADLMMLFLLIAVWHGPGWNIFWWAGFHGAVLGVERLGLATLVRRLPAWLGHVYVVLVVLVGWVVFRADTLSDALQFCQALVGPSRGVVDVTLLTPAVVVALAAGALGAAPLVSWLSRWVVTLDSMATSVLMLVATAVVFTWGAATTVAASVASLWRRG